MGREAGQGEGGNDDGGVERRLRGVGWRTHCGGHAVRELDELGAEGAGRVVHVDPPSVARAVEGWRDGGGVPREEVVTEDQQVAAVHNLEQVLVRAFLNGEYYLCPPTGDEGFSARP